MEIFFPLSNKLYWVTFTIAPIAPVLTMSLEKVIWWAKGYWNVAFQQNLDNYKEEGTVARIIASWSRHGLTDSRNTWWYRDNSYNWIESSDIDFKCKQMLSKYLRLHTYTAMPIENGTITEQVI